MELCTLMFKFGVQMEELTIILTKIAVKDALRSGNTALDEEEEVAAKFGP